MGLKLWALSGHTGLLRWSASVASFYVASKAADILLLTWILTSWQLDSLTRFETGTMLMFNWPSFLQRKEVLVNLLLLNVCLLTHIQKDLCLSCDLTDPTLVLCFPRQKKPAIPNGLHLKIITTLATCYNTTHAIVKRHLLDSEVEFWGKF